MKITFSDQNVPVRLDPVISLCLYRVAQEALQYATSQNEACAVNVELKVEDGRVWLLIADDGLGLSARAAVQWQHRAWQRARAGNGIKRNVQDYVCAGGRARRLKQGYHYRRFESVNSLAGAAINCGCLIQLTFVSTYLAK